MGDFIWRKSLVGMTPRTLEGKAGGTVEAGDILVWNSSGGTLAKSGDAATYRTLAGVAFSGGTTGATILYIPINDQDVYECVGGEAVEAGQRVKIYLNSGALQVKKETARLQVGRVVEVLDATNKKYLMTFGGSALPSS